MIYNCHKFIFAAQVYYFLLIISSKCAKFSNCFPKKQTPFFSKKNFWKLWKLISFCIPWHHVLQNRYSSFLVCIVWNIGFIFTTQSTKVKKKTDKWRVGCIVFQKCWGWRTLPSGKFYNFYSPSTPLSRFQLPFHCWRLDCIGI